MLQYHLTVTQYNSFKLQTFCFVVGNVDLLLFNDIVTNCCQNLMQILCFNISRQNNYPNTVNCKGIYLLCGGQERWRQTHITYHTTTRRTTDAVKISHLCAYYERYVSFINCMYVVVVLFVICFEHARTFAPCTTKHFTLHALLPATPS